MKGPGASYGVGSALALVAGIVGRQWGIAGAVSFLVGVGVNYPFLMGRVEILPYVDMGYLAQAGVACSIPVFYFYYPLGAPMYIPMVCTALALAILKQMWDQAVLVRQLSEQNKEFARLETEFREVAGKLETAMAICLDQSQEMDSLKQTHDVVGSMQERLSALNVRILGLVDVCNGAQTAQTVLARLRTVSRLNRDCEARQAELAQLNRELAGSKDELRKIIDNLSGEQFRLTEDLVKLEARLAQLAGGKS